MKLHRRSKGQVVIESVLISALFVLFTLLVFEGLKDNEFFEKLVGGPWVGLRNIIENGTWGSGELTPNLHPNIHYRHVTPDFSGAAKCSG